MIVRITSWGELDHYTLFLKYESLGFVEFLNYIDEVHKIDEKKFFLSAIKYNIEFEEVHDYTK